MRVRTGTAFRWGPTAFSGGASDFMRVHERDGVFLALLANGYECGFSTCWPPASRLILDLFVGEWTASSGAVRDRLHASFEGARRGFIERAPSLVTPDADFPDDLPSAVLLAVAIEGTAVHIVWIGGDVAALVRGSELVRATTPHTLVELFEREHPELGDLSQVPNVLVRSISERALEQGPPDGMDAEARAGDTILLLSRETFEGPCVPLEDAAREAGAHTRPAAIAERLAHIAFTDSRTPYVAVIAARLDDVELAPEIGTSTRD
jgi:hypothetical protein